MVEDEDSAEAVLDAEDLIKEKGTQILGNAIFAIRRGAPQFSALTLKLSGICKQKNKVEKTSYTGVVTHDKDDDVNYYGHTYMAADEGLSNSDWIYPATHL